MNQSEGFLLIESENVEMWAQNVLWLALLCQILDEDIVEIRLRCPGKNLMVFPISALEHYL